MALCVRMPVARAKKVEGTMSLCLGTNEILASKHVLNMSLLKVRQGHFVTAILILHNSFVFYHG